MDPTGMARTPTFCRVHPALLAQNLASDRTIARSDGYLYGMIRVGRALMPAYGHQIGHYDRWHIVNYVRTLQGPVAGAEEAEN